jgi:serine protease AprX
MMTTCAICSIDLKNLSIRLLLAFVSLVSLADLSAQRQNKYWVEFTDKNDSPYSLTRPAEFLSARALERRARQGIAVVENDLPVSSAYIRVLEQRSGAAHHASSRWLNGAAFRCDSASAARFSEFPFVKSVTYIGPHLRYRNPPNQAEKPRVSLPKLPKIEGFDAPEGYASMQNQVLDLQLPQLTGRRGQGIWVAVMDGGFSNVETLNFFDSVALQGRLFPARDFVERDAAVYESSGHGTSVLSVMAANLPGYFVGTAPGATYFLVKTEDTGGEFPIEEVNWVAGAEWADSLGVDVINASLGYTQFNDKRLGHVYSELDGRTAIGSRGAAIAATKGMIICNSAGNEGDGPWKFIGAPADAPGIVAVGAVDLDGRRAAFSSMGPTADGRIKPDLMAPGDGIVVAGQNGTDLGMSSGTSLASPMLAGALATLWSAYPEKSAQALLAALYRSAESRSGPDTLMGYGLPSISKAWIDLGGFLFTKQALVSIQREHTTATIVPLKLNQTPFCAVEIRNILGEKLQDLTFVQDCRDLSTVDIRTRAALPRGAYQAVLISEGEVLRVPLMVW